MCQAIQTKFLDPTNSRGARVKATADAGSITIAWDHRLGIAENHRAAAVALARKFGWGDEWIGGGLPRSGYAFVRREPATADVLIAAAPTMLAALMLAAQNVTDRTAERAIRAAIAAATGEG